MSDKKIASKNSSSQPRPDAGFRSPTELVFGGSQPDHAGRVPRLRLRPQLQTQPQPQPNDIIPGGASTDRPVASRPPRRPLPMSPYDVPVTTTLSSSSSTSRPSSTSGREIRASATGGVDVLPSPPEAPPPPSDLPPAPPSPFLSSLSPAPTTSPRYVTATKSDDTAIDRIAANFVQAYVDDGLDIKSIGRGNAAPNGGDKAYKEMSRFFKEELDHSGLPAVVQDSKKSIESAYGDKPEKLQTKKSGDADKEGQKVDLDLVVIEPYARPILNFIAGAKQSPGESSMSSGVMKLVNAIDTKLLAALMKHRDDQLKAAALQRDAPDAAARREKIREYGWDEKKFQKLVGQGVYSAKDIDKTRLNLILNLVCTRCITPYIMFFSQPIDNAGGPGQGDIAATTKLLSAGVNRLFNKNYGRFGKAIMAVTDEGLATGTAKALEALRIAERVDSIKQSRHSPSGKDNAYRPKRARQSMPNLLQGDQFQMQMREGKKAHEAALQSISQADYEDNRETEIDEYKRKHAADFDSRDFALTFNKLLRTWKRENSREALGSIAGAMQKLHAQARQALRNDAAQQTDVPKTAGIRHEKTCAGGIRRGQNAAREHRHKCTWPDCDGLAVGSTTSDADGFFQTPGVQNQFRALPGITPDDGRSGCHLGKRKHRRQLHLVPEKALRGRTAPMRSSKRKSLRTWSENHRR